MDKQSRRAKYNRSKTAKSKHKPPENRNNANDNKSTEKVDETTGTKSSSENATVEVKTMPQGDLTEKSNELPKFNKRHLVSNWERYEEPPENERELGDKLRGLDFNDVINFGGTGSVFRFKEDLAWEKEIKTASQAEEFFSLDVDDLTEAILCVPLHRRLLIDPDAFPKKMLTKLEATAHKNSLQYVHKRSVKSRAKADEINKDVILALKESQITTVDEDHSDEDSSEINSVNELNAQVTQNTEVAVDKDNSQKLEEGVDSPKNENLEDDLDNLLSLDKIDTTKANVLVNPIAAQVAPEVKQETLQLFPESSADNLEDWLDTLLETP